jgi:TolB-like protein
MAPRAARLGWSASETWSSAPRFNLYTEDLGNRKLPEKFQQIKEPQSAPTTLASEKPVRGPRRLVAALIILAIAAGTGSYFLSRGPTTKTSPSSATPVAHLIPEKSIAVLPFENLSHDQENAYLADGIQEEILTRLAKISELKVISRTSASKFRSSPDNLREIADKLGVANILEGSVQKSANQLRVNVQLLNAAADAHLWADTYDRKLTDVFAIESEIAEAIADKLQAKLTGREKDAISSHPT